MYSMTNFLAMYKDFFQMDASVKVLPMIWSALQISTTGMVCKLIPSSILKALTICSIFFSSSDAASMKPSLTIQR